MPVKVGCSQCGKQLNVKDEYLGRKLKCPQCGATFTAEIAKTSRAGKLSKPIAAKIHVSKGMIILIVCAIALPSLFAFWRYGPGRVMDDWQKALPDSLVVKALNTVNCEVMVNPAIVNGDSDLFICGNDAGAKGKVSEVLRAFGWKSLIDLGDITNARGTESLMPIWMRLWGHFKTPHFNFKMVK